MTKLQYKLDQNYWNLHAWATNAAITTSATPTIHYVDYGANFATAASPTIYYPQQPAWQQALGGNQYQYMIGQLFGWNYYSSQPPETDAEKAERLERAAKRKAAEQRAEHLLFSILTPAQVKQYTDDRYFDVPIIDRVYRIKRGVARNIELIEGGKPRALLCAHPSNAYDLPIPDVMLSQLLALQANEQEFLRIANRTVIQ